ncbi:MAG TPA: hypothetical protein DCM17_09610 [Dehalococcoidia bacterium]|nr:hypothetical protein [Dehalococcoidia bacterium]
MHKLVIVEILIVDHFARPLEDRGRAPLLMNTHLRAIWIPVMYSDPQTAWLRVSIPHSIPDVDKSKGTLPGTSIPGQVEVGKPALL